MTILAVSVRQAKTRRKLPEEEADTLRGLGIPIVVARIKAPRSKRDNSRAFLSVKPGFEWIMEAVYRWPTLKGNHRSPKPLHSLAYEPHLQAAIRAALRTGDRDLIDACAMIFASGAPNGVRVIEELIAAARIPAT